MIQPLGQSSSSRKASLKYLACCAGITLLFCYAHTKADTAPAITFQSHAQPSTVVELFTSEGCSSCPPADRWLSALKSDPQLFQTLVPMAFHVDYWDYIGWQDPYAHAQYSQRQRQYARQQQLASVYTPGFVVNGKEWRGWFRNRSSHPPVENNASRLPVGVLTGSVAGNRLQATFEAATSGLPKNTANLQLNMAYLGMGLSSQVTAGENARRRLQHDFVVLSTWQSSKMKQTTDSNHWDVLLPPIPQHNQQQTALALWVTQANQLTPIQATATYLPYNQLAF